MNIDFKKIAEKNYVRKASKSNNYWFSIHRSKLVKYKDVYNDNFNIIIYDGDKNSFSDFYIIPYLVLKFLLADEHISQDKRPDKRWVGSIISNRLQIRNCPFDIDIGIYYSNPNLINNNGELQVVNEDLKNDYAIQNRIAEIQIRVRQSVFRKNVLLNFKNTCCLTGIKETELIIASHIIPWSAKIESRLDPSNGLSLFVTYDKLFDLGYISFDNDLKTIITSKNNILSDELQFILENIKGKQAIRPTSFPIKKEYLEYHRDSIFMH